MMVELMHITAADWITAFLTLRKVSPPRRIRLVT